MPGGLYHEVPWISSSRYEGAPSSTAFKPRFISKGAPKLRILSRNSLAAKHEAIGVILNDARFLSIVQLAQRVRNALHR